ncbi:COG1470 family protein [Streptomyces sp. NPDC001139]
MARRSRVRAVAAAVGAAALAAGVFGMCPARADTAEAAQRMTVQFAEHELFIGTEPASVNLSYRWKVAGGGTAHHVHLTVDLFAVADFAEPPPSEHCKDNLCTLDLASATSDYHAITLVPKPGAAVGSSGAVTVSGTASDATVTGDRLTLTNGATQLKVSASPEQLHQVPGDTLTFPLTVWNNGQLPAAKGVQLRIDTTAGLHLQGSWANCRDVPASGRGGHIVREALCDFPTPVEPGRQYALSSPLRVKVGDEALRDKIFYEFTPLTGAAPANGPGTPLTLVPRGAMASDGNTAPYFTTYVNSVNHADFAVTGDAVTGRRGGHATLHATVIDRGPAVVQDLLDDEAWLPVLVKLPPGTKATKIPDNCQPPPTDDGSDPGPRMGRSSYQCDYGNPVPGDRHVLSFTVAIGPRTPAVSTGQVRTLEIMKGLDPDASNDSAALTLRLAQGGSGGSGTPNGSGSGGAAGASGSVSGGPSAGSGPLPDTGFGGGRILWATGALLLAGGAAVALSRRSRGLN